jgi:hypothetical protein
MSNQKSNQVQGFKKDKSNSDVISESQTVKSQAVAKSEGQAKGDSNTQKTGNNQKPFTDHQENSREFENNVCENLARLCQELEKDDRFRVSKFQVKNRKLSLGQLAILNKFWIDSGLQKEVPDKGKNTKKVFEQMQNFEFDFLFVLELSDKGKQETNPPTEVEQVFMNQYRITLTVPSINLVEITIDSSQEVLANKLSQIARHSLILNIFFEYFVMLNTIDMKTMRPENPCKYYPQNLILVSNNDIAMGLKNSLAEYLELAKNNTFTNYLKAIVCQPKISCIMPGRIDIQEILQDHAQNNMLIGHIAVSSIYAQNYANLQLKLDEMEHRNTLALTSIHKNIQEIKQDQEALRKEMRLDQEVFRQDVKHDQEAFRKEVKHDQEAFRQEVKQEHEVLRKEMTTQIETLFGKLEVALFDKIEGFMKNKKTTTSFKKADLTEINPNPEENSPEKSEDLDDLKCEKTSTANDKAQLHLS